MKNIIYYLLLALCLPVDIASAQQEQLQLQAILLENPPLEPYKKHDPTRHFYIDTLKTQNLAHFTPDSMLYYYPKLWGLGLENYTLQFKHKEDYNKYSKKDGKHIPYIMTYYSYKILYKGIPVGHPLQPASVGIHTVNGKITKVVFSQTVPKYINAAFEIKPKINEKKALEIAITHVPAKYYGWDFYKVQAEQKGRIPSEEEIKHYYPKGELRIVDKPSGEICLAYGFDILTWKPNDDNWYVLIDAYTGEVLSKLSTFMHLTDCKFCDNDELQEDSDCSSHETLCVCEGSTQIDVIDVPVKYYDCKNIDVTACDDGSFFSLLNNEANVIDGSVPPIFAETMYFCNENDNTPIVLDENDRIESAAMWSVVKAVEYFKTKGIDGFDNKGGVVKVLAHGIGTSWQSSRNELNLSDGREGVRSAAVSLDGVAHEYAHGVLEEAYQIMSFRREDGEDIVDQIGSGIHEGLADIISVLVRQNTNGFSEPNDWTWRIGDQIQVGDGSGDMDLPRDLSNPYEQEKPQAKYYQDDPYWNLDDPYSLGGVIAYWFYLLTEGGTGAKGDQIAGLKDLAISEAILFKALDMQKGTDANPTVPTFESFSDATIAAAQDLYGKCSLEHTMTLNAWYAVGLKKSNIDCADYLGNQTTTCVELFFDVVEHESPNLNGSVIVTAIGGTKPYDYQWSGGNGSNTRYLKFVPAGIYTVTVTDQANCTVVGTVNILNCPEQNQAPEFEDEFGFDPVPPDVITVYNNLDKEEDGTFICIQGNYEDPNGDLLEIEVESPTLFVPVDGGSPDFDYQYCWDNLSEIHTGTHLVKVILTEKTGSPTSCRLSMTKYYIFEIFSCDDGIQNGDETAIDCGGNCCPSCEGVPDCEDGIENGTELGIDCGCDCPDQCPCFSTSTVSITTTPIETNCHNDTQPGTIQVNVANAPCDNYTIRVRRNGQVVGTGPSVAIHQAANNYQVQIIPESACYEPYTQNGIAVSENFVGETCGCDCPSKCTCFNNNNVTITTTPVKTNCGGMVVENGRIQVSVNVNPPCGSYEISVSKGTTPIGNGPSVSISEPASNYRVAIIPYDDCYRTYFKYNVKVESMYMGDPTIPESAITSSGGGTRFLNSNNFCNGRITIDPNQLPGSGPYHYEWGCGSYSAGRLHQDALGTLEAVQYNCGVDRNNTTNEQTGLCRGTYTVTISDAMNNCVGVASITLEGSGLIGIEVDPDGGKGDIDLVLNIGLTPANFTHSTQINYGLFTDDEEEDTDQTLYPATLSVYSHTHALVDQVPVDPIQVNQAYSVPYNTSALPLGAYFFELQTVVRDTPVRSVVQGVKVSF